MNLAIKPATMVVDTCIVIDFKRAEPMLFSKIKHTLCPLVIAEPLLEELEEEFSNDIIGDLQHLELGILPAHLDDLALAVQESQTGTLSVYDRICLYAAKRMGYGCIETAQLSRTVVSTIM